uniref:Uncharacterized protein n=1 Tax=Ascaris lumbricoides TaxID=6252 RepID=A0A9J2PBY4_ASCLU
MAESLCSARPALCMRCSIPTGSSSLFVKDKPNRISWTGRKEGDDGELGGMRWYESSRTEYGWMGNDMKARQQCVHSPASDHCYGGLRICATAATRGTKGPSSIESSLTLISYTIRLRCSNMENRIFDSPIMIVPLNIGG